MFSFITTNKRQVLTAEQLTQPFGYYDNTMKVLGAIMSKDKSFFRVEKDYHSGVAIHESYNDAEIQKYYGTPSYNQFNQKYYIRFLAETGIIKGNDELMTRWAPGLINRPLLQTIAGVKYFLSKGKLNDFQKANYRPFYISGDVTASQSKYFLPLGFTYDRVISMRDFKKLNPLQKDIVLLKAFVAENEENDFQDFDVFDKNILNEVYTIRKYGEDVSRLNQESMIMTDHSQNSIKGTIKISRKKLLFFSIPYDKGWSITIDGKKAETKLINIGFIGVIIPPGIHNIELSYVPPFLVSGTLVMIASFLLYLLLILKNKRSENGHIIRNTCIQ